MSLARNVDLLRRLPKLDGLRLAEFGNSADSSSPLQEVTDFGANPGNLRMFAFVPAQLQQPHALVVVLHGCGQTAASYDLGAGWSTLASHYGFALLMPEQQRVNNGNTCFNWFNPEDTARDSGEARSIREMIAHMVEAHDIDLRRVFITGLSAGGGMTSVMLATYPEIFAAGAVIAGLPYGIASNLREALDGMFHSPERSASALGDLVRDASDHRGPWPKISVWHGSADRTVNPGNANEIVKQWLDLHDLPAEPMAETDVDGYPRQAWWNRNGETLVESYTITDMAHGTPLGIADNDHRYGMEGAFLIEAGISSSYHIAKFFGLTDWIRSTGTAKPTAKPAVAAKPPAALSPAPHLARSIRSAMAEQPAEPKRKPKRKQSRGFDLGAFITRALTAAGLMK
ncbi:MULTISPECIES: PHB depolymerase family esterase [unclassified Bradyrhizobium]|uniref:extracellular catalytic domain type 1 short-chain-length polyhydroxyalkanoate depolymerase n=1 Tax=unclassified Bradyrhizobium TaxID=2631580 RepID=UPI00247ABD39|nr:MULTISPECIES: PHB depolymerase family esterase [unclassified Bradyrhizobium]WGR71300.1 PHB depolymerase family esterase [Bradyrhizobium sp. ISRA426]WGR76135.1 PHB depolymerase family esterase [Bradyrhizobium sp. ISRA430]WGR86540.1 PHB depolymerase family esterase [Bradyrhizobium sp. ISRA432]